ncbi:MAG TPA: transporter [Bryobacteraceae bacterium]|nr:transporter [Bryobacteraceae bacterium]
MIALLGAILLRGQNPPAGDDAISTDRPAVANASTVVPQGSFQIENGFLLSKAHSFDLPETNLRFGLTATTELRLSVPDYYFNGPTGFGDISIGLKQQFGPAAGFDVSLIAFLSFPTGANAISSHGYDPGLQLPWSRKLSDNWSVGGQFALYWPTQSDGRNLTGESTFLFDRQLTKPMDAFIEYAGDFPERGGPQHLLHFGAAYRIAARHQVDAHVGVGLSSAAIDHFIGIGYSFRFQAVRR